MIYDLQNGKCVVVNEKGWRIVDNIYPMFLKGADEIEQVMPIHGSGKKGLDRIDRYLNLSPEEKFLLKVYLVTCFNPDIRTKKKRHTNVCSPVDIPTGWEPRTKQQPTGLIAYHAAQGRAVQVLLSAQKRKDIRTYVFSWCE